MSLPLHWRSLALGPLCLVIGGVALGLAGCASPRPATSRAESPVEAVGHAAPATATAPGASPAPAAGPSRPFTLPATAAPTRSRWVSATWEELPGFDSDPLHEFWSAWLNGCERPPADHVALCRDVRLLSLADDAARRNWLKEKFRPLRVESTQGQSEGLMTAYYEPTLEASRTQRPGFAVPLYRPPEGLVPRQTWHTRRDIETRADAREALRGREIAWVADPIDALVLHIQGSGRLRVTEPDGSQRVVRLSYGGSNEWPYKSVGRWLIEQGAVRDASWPAIKQWLVQNPQRVNELMWSNPRYVFFKEEALAIVGAGTSPRGAQGVALTPGRSIAVDPASIPFGTPVWLHSPGPTASLRRLVLAQDTGGAIVGAVRADYFLGSGGVAGESAARMRQPLWLWVLQPR